jgi:hypothetical protein
MSTLYFFQMRDEFEAEDFCTAVFDEFFFASIAHDNTVRHLLRDDIQYKHLAQRLIKTG